MIDAMARAGASLAEPKYISAAFKAAEFITKKMQQSDGRLFHTWRAGSAKFDAYLDDYASLANSLVSLYEATGDDRWIDEAVRLLDIVLNHFADPAGGGFFYTATDHEPLIARNKELTDSSTPSGNALAANALLRLGRLLGRSDYLDAAERTLAAAAPIMQRAPMATGQMLLALDRFLGPSHELVLLGDYANDATGDAIELIQGRYLPRSVFGYRLADAKNLRKSSIPAGPYSQHVDPLFAGKSSPDGEPVLYICQNFACQAPAIGLAAIGMALDAVSRSRPTQDGSAI